MWFSEKASDRKGTVNVHRAEGKQCFPQNQIVFVAVASPGGGGGGVLHCIEKRKQLSFQCLSL